MAPGANATDLFFKCKPSQVVDAIKAANPFNRLGQPEQIAGMVKYMCGEDKHMGRGADHDGKWRYDASERNFCHCTFSLILMICLTETGLTHDVSVVMSLRTLREGTQPQRLDSLVLESKRW